MNRYDRQERVRQIGAAGQAKIGQSTILIAGLGALGSYAAEQLVRAGVKGLILVDPDTVTTTNLQRQALFTEDDAKQQRLKVVAAKEHLQAINPTCQITVLPAPLSPDIITSYQFNLCLDCLDNYSARDLLNRLALTAHFDYIFASCAGTYGNVMAISPQEHPCLNCLFPNLEELKQTDCDLIGVNTALVPTISGLQISLALHYLVDKSSINFNELLTVDNWTMQFERFHVTKDPACLSCREGKRALQQVADGPALRMLCGEDAYYTVVRELPEMVKLREKLQQDDVLLNANPLFIHFRWDNLPVSIFKNGKIIMYNLADNTAAQRQLISLNKLLQEVR